MVQTKKQMDLLTRLVLSEDAQERAMQIGDLDVIRRYFGNTIDPGRGKPMLTQFITRIAEVVQEAQDG